MDKFINKFWEIKTWKEAVEGGKSLGKWDGNGSVKEWEKKSVKEGCIERELQSNSKYT